MNQQSEIHTQSLQNIINSELNTKLEDQQSPTSNNGSLSLTSHDEPLQYSEHKAEIFSQGEWENQQDDTKVKYDNVFDEERKYEKDSEELKEKLFNFSEMDAEKSLPDVTGELESQTSNFVDAEQNCERIIQSASLEETVITDVNKCSEELPSQTRKNETCQTKCDEAVILCEKNKSENILLHAKLEEMKNELEVKNNLLFGLERKYEKSSLELQEKDKQLQAVRSELNTQTSNLSHIEQQNELLKQTFTEKEATIKDLVTQLEDLNTNMSKTESLWQAKHEEVVLRCEKHKNENSLLQGNQENLKTDLKVKDDLLIEIERKYEKVSEELQVVQFDRGIVVDLKNQLQTVRDELETKTSSSDILEQRCETLTKSVTEKDMLISDLNKQMEDFQTETNNAETLWHSKYDEVVLLCEKHKSENSLLQEKVETLTNDLETKNSLLFDTKGDLEKASEGLQESENQLQAVRDELETMSASFENLKQQSEMLAKTQTEERDTIISDLNKQLADLQTQTINTETLWQSKHDEVVLLCEKHKSENSLLQEKVETLTHDLETKDNLLIIVEGNFEKTSKNLQEGANQLLTVRNELESKTLSIENLEQQCETMTKTVTEKETSITEMSKELENLKTKHDELALVCEKHKSESKLSQDEIERLTRDLETRDSLLFTTKGDLEKVSERLQESENQLQIVRDKLETMSTSFENLKQQSEMLAKTQTEERDTIISDLNKQLVDLQTQTINTETLWQSKHDEVVLLCEKHKSENSLLQEKVETLTHDLETKDNLLIIVEGNFENTSKNLQEGANQLLTVRNELESKTLSIENLEQQCETMTKTVTEKETSITEMSKELENLKTKHDELALVCEKHKSESKLSQDEIERLTRDLETRDSLLFTTKGDLEKVSERLQESENQLQIVRDELETMSTSFENLKQQSEMLAKTQTEERDTIISDLNKQLADLQTQTINTETLWQSKHDEVVLLCEKYKSEKLHLQDQLEKLKDELDVKGNYITEMERKYEEVSEQLQDRCHDLMISLSDNQSNHDIVVNLEEKLQTLKDQMLTQTAGFNELESKWIKLNEDHVAKQKETSAINSLLAETKMECEKLRQQLKYKEEEFCKVLEEKTFLLSDMETKCEDLSIELQDKSYKLIISLSEKHLNCDLVSDLEKEVQHLKYEIESKSSNVEVLESQLMTLSEQNMCKSQEISTTKSLLCEMEKAHDQLAQQLLNKEAEISAASSDNELRECRVSQMQNEIQTLIADLQTRTSMIEELEKTNAALKQDLLIEQDNLSAKSELNKQQSEDLQAMKKSEELKMIEVQEKIGKLENEILDSKAFLEAEINASNALRCQIDGLNISHQELNTAVESYQSDIEIKMQENLNLQKLCADNDEQLNVLKVKCSSLEDNLCSCKAELSTNQDLTKSYIKELEEMKTILEKKTEILEQTENKVNLMQRDLISKDEEMSQNENKIKDLEEKLKFDEQRLRCEKENVESKAAVESELETTRMALVGCQQQIEQVLSDNGCLKSSVESIKAEKNLIKEHLMAIISATIDLRENFGHVKKTGETILQKLSGIETESSVAGVELEENAKGKNTINDDDFEDASNCVLEEETEIIVEKGNKNVFYLKKELTNLSNHFTQLETIIASQKSKFTSELDSIRKSLEVVTIDRDSLETNAKDLEQQNSNLHKQIEKIDETCKELQSTVSENELKVSELIISASSKEKQIFNLEVQFEEDQAQVQQMSKELEALVEEKLSLETKLFEMEKQIEKSHTSVNKKTGLENAQADNYHVMQECGNGDHEIQDRCESGKGQQLELDSSDYLKQEMEYFKKENEVLKKERLEQNLNEECLKAELLCLKSDMSTTNLNNESFSTQKFDTNEQFWNLTVEKEALQKELDQTKVELEAAKLELETDKIVERDVANLKETLAQSHFDISELQCQLDYLESEKSIIEKDFKATKQENVNLSVTLHDIQDRNKALEGRLQELMTNESNLNKEAIQNTSELNEFQVQYEKLHDLIAKSGSQPTEGNAKKGQGVSKNGKKLSKSDSKLRLDMTNDLKHLTAEKESLKEKVADLEKELSETKKVLDERTESMETDHDEKVKDTLEVQSALNYKMDEIQKEKVNIEAERNSLLQKNKELFEEYQRVVEKNKILELKIEEFSCAAQDVRDDLTKLHDVIKDQNESLARKKKEIVVKANEIDTLRIDLAELFTKIQEKQQEIDSLTEVVSKLKRELKESNSNAGTLEDVVEALNCDMAALEDEKSSLASNLQNAEEKIKELQNEVQTVKQSIKETKEDKDVKKFDSKENDDHLLELRTAIEILKNDNEELKKIKELDSDLRKDFKISQEALENKSMECEDLILQVGELKTEIAESFQTVKLIQDKLSSSETQLSEFQLEIKEKNKKISVLLEEQEKDRIALEIKGEEITKLTGLKADLNNQLELKNEELILICDEKELLSQQIAEEVKKCEILTSSNESLLCQLGEKEDGLNNVIKKYKDSSESLESMKVSLTSQLKEKEDEVYQLLQSQQSAQKQISDTEKQVSKLEKTIQSKDDELQKLSTNLSLVCDELQQSKSSKDDTCFNIQKLEKDLLDKDTKLQQIKDEHKTMLSQVIEVAEKLEREKEELSVKLLEAQSTSAGLESGKEILIKWEQRCKELDSNLKMERRKCQGLTEQINALKASETYGGHKEIEKLKSELNDVKKDRDCMRDERQQIFQKAKEHKDKAELLTCRIRVLTHMLKKQGKGCSKTQTPDDKADDNCSNNEKVMPKSDNAFETNENRCHSKTDIVNKSPSKATLFAQDSKEKQDKDKSEIVHANSVVDENVKNAEAKTSTSLNFSPSIQRKELASPPSKKLSPLSLRKRTSKLSSPSSSQVSTNSKKEDEREKIASEVNIAKMPKNTEDPISSPKPCEKRISTRKRNSSQSSQSSISKEDLCHGDAQTNLINEQPEPVSRVTRSSLRKRESTESLPLVVDSKKSRVIYEDPMSWLEGPSKQAKPEQSLTEVKNSKSSTTCEMSGPSTRSKVKETTSKVLNPITNSPVKESQHQPKGFLRKTNRYSERKALANQGKDEAAQNCNTQ